VNNYRIRVWFSRFRTWQGDLKASSATIQILLSIAAIAFGMTAFAALTLDHGVRVTQGCPLVRFRFASVGTQGRQSPLLAAR
jgi:hypothetical protein